MSLIAFNPVHASESQTHRIEIRDFNFFPAEIMIKPGDTVIWINKDFVPHTVTAINKQWDSGFIEVNAQWQLVINDESIENYFCLYHPNMKAHLSIIKLSD